MMNRIATVLAAAALALPAAALANDDVAYPAVQATWSGVTTVIPAATGGHDDVAWPARSTQVEARRLYADATNDRSDFLSQAEIQAAGLDALYDAPALAPAASAAASTAASPSDAATCACAMGTAMMHAADGACPGHQVTRG